MVNKVESSQFVPDPQVRDPALEYPDPTPCAMPLGCERPEPLADMIRRLVRNEWSAQAAEAGEETFDEANDFEVDEDPDTGLFSPYELLPLQEERPNDRGPAESSRSSAADPGSSDASDGATPGDSSSGGVRPGVGSPAEAGSMGGAGGLGESAPK